jgi:hypothetical protein
MQKIADALIRWMISSGLFAQLSFLVTKTALLRQGVVMFATYLAAHGAMFKGLTSEFWIGILLAAFTTLLNAFVSYVRNKYAAELQAALNTQFPINFDQIKIDSFIGPKTLQRVQMVFAQNKDKSSAQNQGSSPSSLRSGGSI